MKKVSQQTIADCLGISKGTVSLVLSGKAKNKRVSEDLSARILSKAMELNYQPNELARGLRTGETKTFGVIVADISNEFFGSLVYYIQKRSKKYNYSVITVNTDESSEQFDGAMRVLMNKCVDGIIAVPADGSLPSLKRVVNSGVPVVQIDRYFSELDTSYVVLDNYGASYKTVEKLYSEGCRKIALIKHKNNVSVNLTRTSGFVDAMKDFGIFDKSIVKTINYNNEEADIRKAMLDLFDKPNDIDAVFFMSHELFITGVKYFFKMKIRIPDDVKVACFDKVEAFSILNFPLICVEQPIKEMAERSVDILVSQIQGGCSGQKNIFDGKICTT